MADRVRDALAEHLAQIRTFLQQGLVDQMATGHVDPADWSAIIEAHAWAAAHAHELGGQLVGELDALFTQLQASLNEFLGLLRGFVVQGRVEDPVAKIEAAEKLREVNVAFAARERELLHLADVAPSSKRTGEVFISHSARDHAVAERLLVVFEEVGLSCWIAPRDIPPGAEFDQTILNAIDSARALVVVLSADANTSPYVAAEVNRAFSQGKPIFTFRTQDIAPAKVLELYLARHQWTDGFCEPPEEQVARMAAALREWLAAYE